MFLYVGFVWHKSYSLSVRCDMFSYSVEHVGPKKVLCMLKCVYVSFVGYVHYVYFRSALKYVDRKSRWYPNVRNIIQLSLVNTFTSRDPS